MALAKITDSDLAGKGVSGQADVPGLSAAAMQAKIEEIVRDVVIPKFNGNVDETELIYATKAALDQVILESGAVTSVFGRAGAITAQQGDYTPAQIGAAPEVHATQHKTGGTDVIAPADIGAAPAVHAHGNVTSDGKIGITNGLIVCTEAGGTVTAKSIGTLGLETVPASVGGTGAITVTLANNKAYNYTAVTSLAMTGNTSAEASGFIAFTSAASHSVTLTGFTAVGGDDITEASASELWEFSLKKGCIVFKNWSA